jgi:WD40 repeat protein
MGVVRLWDVRSSAHPLGKSEVHSGKVFCVEWADNQDDTAMADGNTESPLSNQTIFSGGSDCFVRKHAMST